MNKMIFITKRSTIEEYESYANNPYQEIILDDNHKSEYIINSDEIVRRIINGYNQWTQYGASNKGNIYDIDAGMILLPKKRYCFNGNKDKYYLSVQI